MATYRFSAKLISRSAGRCAPAAAAYRAGQRIANERTSEIFDYRRRSDVLSRAVLAPQSSPSWAHDRASLWNAAEAAERRKDAQVAREVQVSLPHELSLEQSMALLHAFVQEQFVARGMVADIAVHAAHRGGDERNVHAHVLLTTRAISLRGFGAKAREWNERALLATWRCEWERHVNGALELYGVSARVDHRSYVERGLDIEPEPKQGPVATKLERSGQRSKAGDDRRAAQRRNSERVRLRSARSAIERSTMSQCRLHENAGTALTMGNGAILDWKRWRIHELSKEYELDMTLSPIARYWRLQRIEHSLVFFNQGGRFEDRGDIRIATSGSRIRKYRPCWTLCT